MASTNKTANLGLNQWVLSDPLLMEDMNEDNRRIDAAASGNQYVKLLDVTTSANAQQVDLDVSKIDFTKYVMVQVFVTAKVTPMGSTTCLLTKINNSGAYYKDIQETSTNSREYVGYVYTNTSDSFFSNLKMEISGIPTVLTSAYLANLKVYGSSWYNAFYVHEQSGVKSFDANTRITSINFVTDNSNVKIRDGSRFEIYGVRK